MDNVKIHKIHDLENQDIINLLKEEFSKVSDNRIFKNYNPEYSASGSDLFYLLENGRYRKNNGAYYVVESLGEFICSAGWNRYEFEPNVAIALSRAYVSKKYRAMYTMGEYILPLILEDSRNFHKVWITCNDYNKSIYNWFVRVDSNKSASICNAWPEIYSKFKPIGMREVYFTQQYVAECVNV